MVNKINLNTKNAILNKSAKFLPDKPSEYGMTSEDIKKAFYSFATDDENSIISEINRIVEEINNEANSLKNHISSSIEESINSIEKNKADKSDLLNIKIYWEE